MVQEYLESYKVGIVLDVQDCGNCKGSKKALRACKVQISQDPDVSTVSVVTSATNVRQGSRVVVAPAGSTVIGDTGEPLIVTIASVGGHTSEGIFCDSAMLGWTGGAKGVAAQAPESCPLGSAPPSSKPRPAAESQSMPAPADEPGLFDKKLSKQEKKKLAEERRKARKDKKQETTE